MICPQCNNGFIIPDAFSPIVSSILRYRGHKKVVATGVLVCCNNCSHSVTELIEDIDINRVWTEFKREVNIAISLGDIV